MAKIIGNALPNIPWQDKPQGYDKPVWRYDHNPIIPRDLIPTSNSIFNSAVVPFEGKFAGVFRCDNRSVEMDIFAGFSDDGILAIKRRQPGSRSTSSRLPAATRA